METFLEEKPTISIGLHCRSWSVGLLRARQVLVGKESVLLPFF